MQKLSAKHFYKNRIRQSQKNVKAKVTYLQCHVMQHTLEMSIKNKDIQGEITPCYRNRSMLKRSYFVVHIAIAATNSYEAWIVFYLLPRMAFKKQPTLTPKCKKKKKKVKAKGKSNSVQRKKKVSFSCPEMLLFCVKHKEYLFQNEEISAQAVK